MKETALNQLQEFITKHQDSNETDIMTGLRQLMSKLQYKEREEQLANYVPEPLAELALREVEYVNNKHLAPLRNISSGFKGLDRELGYFHPGEFVVFGGRPGMGKTQFMVQLCANFLKQGYGVGYFTLDLGKETIFKRLVCNISEISMSEIESLESNMLKQALNRNIDSIKNWPLYIDDSTSFRVHDIVTISRKLVTDYGVKIIMVDYLQLLNNGYGYRYNREQELAGISRELKKLARELNILVICSSQLSRQVENRPGGSKRPQLSDLRESGAIEQDADKVLFIYRPEYYGLEVDEYNMSTRNKVEILIAKNRTGSLGQAVLFRNRGFSAFKDETEIAEGIDDFSREF